MRRAALAAIAAILTVAPAAHAATWVQHPGPVLAATLPWEGTTVQEPTVMWDKGRYRLWYTGGWWTAHLGYAESRDGYHWHKKTTPVLWDATHSNVVKTRRGFIIYSGRADGVLTIAYTHDGTNVLWRKELLRPQPGAWTDRGIANTFAWRNHSGWQLLYEALGPDGWQTALAEGDGSAWTWRHATSPLSLGFGGMAGGPWKDGRCLYFHASTSGGLPTDIYRRCGPSLLHLGPPLLMVEREQPTWQVDQVADPSIAHRPDHKPLMMFSGMDNIKEVGYIGAAKYR